MDGGKKSLYEWCIENNLGRILEEWDYKSNTEITPHTITYGSARKVFWKCSLGHSWEGEIKERTIKGRNCPICSNDKVLIGYNDFATWCHQHDAEVLLKEWDYEKNDVTPNDIVFGHRKPVWWKCTEGHSFQKNIRYRIGKGEQVRKCPYCRGVRVVAGDKSFGTVAPELLEEWDKDKNSGSPSDYTYGSSKYVWWKCKKCGNEWKAKISHRVNGVGCPPCSYRATGDKLMIPKEGRSLKDLRPELLEEWNYSKNGELLPDDFAVGSNKKVWWLCKECGTEWESAICHRSQGKGCPSCMKEKRRENFIQGVLDKQGSLADSFPDLVEEWDYEKNTRFNPNQISGGSEERVWWKCKRCGNSWQTLVVRRTKRKQGCPECRKELRTSFPEKAVFFYVQKMFADAIENYRPEWLEMAELDIFVPSVRLGIEYDGTAFHKNIEKDLRKNKLCAEREVKLLRIREPKCPVLNSSSIDFQMNSFREPDLEKSINLVLNWIERNYSLCNIPIVSLDKDKGCIYELMNLQSKVNSLENRFPELVKEWHPTKNFPLTPDKVTGKSNKKVWWLCSRCGREWQAVVGSRSSGTGCICQARENRLKSLGVYSVNKSGSLLETNPIMAREWHPTKNGDLSPADVTEHSNKKVWWLSSTCGHEWRVSINQKKSCPYCGNRKVLIGFNDLETTRPDLAAEWHPFKNEKLSPTMVSKGSHSKAWWLCATCGYEWESVIKNRAMGHGCPKCGIKKAMLSRKESGK